jgi:hypothetical protein
LNWLLTSSTDFHLPCVENCDWKLLLLKYPKLEEFNLPFLENKTFIFLRSS